MSSILRALRLVGATVAVAAGILSFASAEAPAPADGAVIESAPHWS